MTAVPLIPRRTLFGNPERVFLRISPDGAFIAYLGPLDGVLNVWVAPRDDLDAARPITHDIGRGIQFFQWAYTGRHILYIQDRDGDENWRIYSVDVTTGAERNLTPFEGVQAQIKHTSPRFPEEIVIGLNNRDPRWHDIYRLNITAGYMVPLEENNQYLDFTLDDDYNLRLALRVTAAGAMEISQRTAEGTWEVWDTVPAADALTTGPLGMDKSGTTVFMRDSRGRDTSAVTTCDLTTRQCTLLAADPRVDAEEVLVHPTERYIQAVSFVYERQRWQALDPSIEPDLAYLRTLADAEVEIVSRTLDDQLWMVALLVDDGPFHYYLYDRRQRAARFMFTSRPALEGQPLVKMRPAVVQARDGVDLVAYYSLPLDSDSDGDGIPDQPLPMVLFPHGGPWGRDIWGFNPYHQWLANRGYAVLCVNFRASTGFGKDFTNAGDRQWAGAVIQDQADAVQWAVQAGIADRQRVAVMGISFGGYSTLAGLTFFPDLYACGVDICGPSNLVTLLESIPPYWTPQLELFTARIGDHRTEAGRAFLKSHSPLTYVDRICRPLLIGQGANDVRVKRAEADQVVQAMQAKGIPVTYLLYPDEGHGFVRPENELSFNAIAEAFLARCLGGRAEPIGPDFQGSSLQVLVGAGEVPGLKEALA